MLLRRRARNGAAGAAHPYYFLLNLDILAAWLFVLSAAILLFRLPPVTVYRPVVVYVLAICPVVYRLLAVTFGGGSFAYGFVMVIFSAAAVSYACGRGRSIVLPFGLCSAAGAAAIAIVSAAYPRPGTSALQLVATTVSLVVGPGGGR